MAPQKSNVRTLRTVNVGVNTGGGALSLALVLLLAGCSAPSPSVEADSTVLASNASIPRDRVARGVMRLSELTRQSIADLAGRLGIDQSEIVVVEARQVIWPDNSAGCPEPGFNYLQVLTEGVLIRLRFGEHIFQYHGGRSGPAFLCEKPSSRDPESRYEVE